MNALKKKFKALFICTFSTIVLILVLLALGVYVIDPYQQFRKSDQYINDARLEIPGVSMHHEYNAVLMGSSMAMNHEPRQVDSLFSQDGEKWITRNFTLIGGMSDDYQMILERVMKDGKVKHIIFDLDYFAFAKQANAIADYLYKDSWFGKLKYIFNYTTLENCYKRLNASVPVDSLSHFDNKIGHKPLLDGYEVAKKESFLKNGYHFDSLLMRQRFNDHLFDYIKAYPNVEWYIYFPPYSVFEFIRYRDAGSWPTILQFKQYVVEELLKQPNVKLYDFQGLPWIMDLDQYMDVRHHSHAVNHAIIRSMAEGRCRVTSDNYQEKIDSLNHIVAGINTEELIKSLQ